MGIKLALIEDHPLFLELLHSSLEVHPDLDILWTASSVSEAREKFAAEPVDVVILDVELSDGNGVGLGLGLSRDKPDLGVILLSNLDLKELLTAPYLAEKRGWSYLSKSTLSSTAALVEVIKLSVTGQGVADPSLLRKSHSRDGGLEFVLTARQIQVLELVAQGKSNSEVAELLGIAQNSVINHLSAIYAALEIAPGQNSRVAAVLRYLAEHRA